MTERFNMFKEWVSNALLQVATPPADGRVSSVVYVEFNQVRKIPRAPEAIAEVPKKTQGYSFKDICGESCP